jgi:hypothetical protein
LEAPHVRSCCASAFYFYEKKHKIKKRSGLVCEWTVCEWTICLFVALDDMSICRALKHVEH